MSRQHRGFVRVSEGDAHGCDPWLRGEGEGAKAHVLSLLQIHISGMVSLKVHPLTWVGCDNRWTCVHV
jgi:hypothetical protein